MANCAENLSGLKHITEDADCSDFGFRIPDFRFLSDFWYSISDIRAVVGEHSICDEAESARICGAYGRENVGMSNRNPPENGGPRKSKGSFAMEISEGLGGPKAMAKAVVDGQSVNIPTHSYDLMERRGFVGKAP